MYQSELSPQLCKSAVLSCEVGFIRSEQLAIMLSTAAATAAVPMPTRNLLREV
jgi:hypothetical protein